MRRAAAAIVEPIEAGYLSLRSLATYSGLSVRRLRAALTDPVCPLPHFKLPGKVLVRRTDFDAWLSRYRVEVAAAAGTSARASLRSVVEDVVRRIAQ